MATFLPLNYSVYRDGNHGKCGYDLRHTHLSLHLSNGESVTTVAQRAGHKTAHTTLTIYAHAIAGEQKAMVARMDESYLRAANIS
tara:strand:+ start:579 stop:833 length:255 start_codon:yes stop_codon:yes gene_type:complete